MNVLLLLGRWGVRLGLSGCLALTCRLGPAFGHDGPVLPLPPGPVLPAPLLPAPLLPPPPGPDCLPKDPLPPVLKIKVRVPAAACPGELLEYVICVENCSPSEAHHVVVRNPLPYNAAFVRADPMPTKRGEELQWQLGTIGAGARRQITLCLQPTNNEDVKNCARVQFEHGECVVTRIAGGGGEGGPRVIPVPPGGETIPLPGDYKPAPPKPPIVQPPPKVTETGARLNVTVEGNTSQYVNLASRYFLTVSNPGTEKATTVLLMATLPEKMAVVSASNQGQILQNQVVWYFESLEPGAKKTVQVMLRAIEAGDFCVKGSARADKGLSVLSEACTTFIGVSALTVDLRDDPDPVLAGTKTSYMVVIRNQGSATVTNLKLRALVPPGLVFERAQPAVEGKVDGGPGGTWINFPVYAKLEPNSGDVTYKIFVEAGRQPGASRFRIELAADQLERGPIIEEENTTIFEDLPEPPRKQP